jgi:hypothetical protein
MIEDHQSSADFSCILVPAPCRLALPLLPRCSWGGGHGVSRRYMQYLPRDGLAWMTRCVLTGLGGVRKFGRGRLRRPKLKPCVFIFIFFLFCLEILESYLLADDTDLRRFLVADWTCITNTEHVRQRPARGNHWDPKWSLCAIPPISVVVSLRSFHKECG